MDILQLSIAQLLLGVFFVGALVLFAVVLEGYFREIFLNDDRSETSWNDEHNFFDKITEYRNDLSRS